MNYILRIIDDMSISGQELAELISTLPAWRQQIVMKYKFEGGRRESALAFRMLQDILRDNKMLPEEEIKELRFSINEHGKPSIEGHENVFFNFSHCKNAVACVVSSEPVGVDVECIGRYNKGVAEYTLSEEELKKLEYDEDGCPRDENGLQLQFTAFWTKKEAVLKLIGTGITDDVKNILHLHNDDVIYETTICEEKKFICTVARYR